MKPIYTLGMLVVLLALGIYVYVFERKPVPANTEAPKPKIITVDPTTVKSLSISRGTEKTRLEKDKPGHWRLISPKSAEADSGAVQTLLDHIKDWQAAEVLDPQFKASEKSSFGLAANPLKLEIASRSGKKEILIGNKTPINSGYYVLSADGKQLYLSFLNVPEELEQMLKQPPLPKPSTTPVSQKK